MRVAISSDEPRLEPYSTSIGVLCPGRAVGRGGAFGADVATATGPANSPRSVSLRGRTFILKPSGLIVSVSFRCIW